MPASQVREALDRLADDPPTVVCLPDLFLDHFVRLDGYEDAEAALRAIHDRGGGNLTGTHQRVAPGGNAANTAHALGRLGVAVSLVGNTSAFGRSFAEATLGKAGVDLTHLRSEGELACTVALEFGPRRTNVMLNHAGSVATFAPLDLEGPVADVLRDADAVLVANWANMALHGTDVVRQAFQLAREGGALTYLDTSDPTDRLDGVPELLERVVDAGLVDVFAMNESELARYGGGGTVEEGGQRFSKRLHGTLDVHTGQAGHTWGPAGNATVPVLPVTVQRTTGAGDVWNAGNLVGHLVGLGPEDRLRLAHAMAAAYIGGEDARPPTADEVARLLASTP